MNSKEDSLLNALRIVKHRLTAEVWNKNAYFAEKNGKLCMCPHGVAQSVINPEVKKIINAVIARRGSPRACYGACAASTGGADTVAAAALVSARGANWNDRPSWIQETSIYGNLEIHYLMGMVGLDISFNDHPKTTFPMVQAKLDQAIALAEKLGV